MSESDDVLSLSDDDLGWLKAYNKFLQEPVSPPTRSVPIPIPAPVDPVFSPVGPNDSLTLPRLKAMPRKQHGYLAPTKASSAKSVRGATARGRSSATQSGRQHLLKGPLHPDLHDFKNEKRFPHPKTKHPDARFHEDLGPITEGTEPLKSRSGPEWIYRRPKSPNATVLLDSPNGSPRRSPTPTSPTRRPVTGYAVQGPSLSSSAPPTPSAWLKTSKSMHRRDISLPILNTSPKSSRSPTPMSMSISQSSMDYVPTTPQSGSSRSSSSDSPCSTPCPDTPIGVGRYNRDPSIFDLLPTLGPSGSAGRASPTKSILSRTKPNSHSGTSSYTDQKSSRTTRNNSISTTRTTSSSNKSVKFVDEPTVHYASVGYWSFLENLSEDGHGSGGVLPRQEEGAMMDIDMDIDVVSAVTPTKEKHRVILREDFDADPSPMDIDVPDKDAVAVLQGLPPLKSLQEEAKEKKKKFKWPGTGLERKPSSASLLSVASKSSAMKSAISKPAKAPEISGPFALGSLNNNPSYSKGTGSKPSIAIPYLSGISSGNKHRVNGMQTIANRSVDSLRSVKSGGGRSVKSFVSLRSIPGSLGGTISKSVGQWFKSKATIEFGT